MLPCNASCGGRRRCSGSGIWVPACCSCVVVCYSPSTTVWLHSELTASHLSPSVTQPSGQQTSLASGQTSGPANTYRPVLPANSWTCSHRKRCWPPRQPSSHPPAPEAGEYTTACSERHPSNTDDRPRNAIGPRLDWLSRPVAELGPAILHTTGLRLKHAYFGVLQLTSRNLPGIPNWPNSRWGQSGEPRYYSCSSPEPESIGS